MGNNRGFSLLTIILILALLTGIGGVGYYVYQSRDKDSESVTSQTGTETPDKAAQTPAEKLALTKEKIEAAMNAKDYDSLSVYMEDEVYWAIAASDGFGTTPKDQVTENFDYFGPDSSNAQTPWDFDVLNNDADFAERFNKSKAQLFADFNYVGLSKDKGSFIAFRFSNDGLISGFWYGLADVI